MVAAVVAAAAAVVVDVVVGGGWVGGWVGGGRWLMGGWARGVYGTVRVLTRVWQVLPRQAETHGKHNNVPRMCMADGLTTTLPVCVPMVREP